MGDTFLKLEGWEELSGCDDPHFTRDIVVVNLVGLSAHLWCFDLFKKVGDLCVWV